jgi:hypothetical protein
MSRSTQYIRLRNLISDDTSTAQDGSQYVTAHDRKTSQNSLRGPATVTSVFIVSIVLNVFLLGNVLISKNTRDRILTYCEYGCIINYISCLVASVANFALFHTAPALPAVNYERVVFSSGFGIEQSPFQGQPSDENDRLWAGLYDCKLR